METRCCSFNLDDRAFERVTVGLMQPILIMVVFEDAAEDDNTVVNPRLAQQPRLGMPSPGQEPPNTDESLSMAFIMANAPDLKAFQELEGYIFSELDSGSEIDVPEDYDESDVSDDNDIGVDVVSDVAGEY